MREKTGEVVNGVETTEMKKLRAWGERMTYKLGIKHDAKSGNKVPLREEITCWWSQIPGYTLKKFHYQENEDQDSRMNLRRRPSYLSI